MVTRFGYGSSKFLHQKEQGKQAVDADVRTLNLRFYKNLLYDNNHEGLWKRFVDFLAHVDQTLLSHLPQAESETVSDKIKEILRALRNWNSQNGNWLSRIRNLINYSQSYGISATVHPFQ